MYILKGMVVCKIGGPAYRIGMGGGAASSRVQGTADAALDFNAVQRGDAEMENRMNRVVRGCIELGDVNPIISIHDQVYSYSVLLYHRACIIYCLFMIPV
jgi:phosphoribosylformylglycinamidine synthase